MTDRERLWRSVDPSRLSALLSHAPLFMAILAGEDLSIEQADPPLLEAFGASCPGRLPDTALGAEGASAVASVRETGSPWRASISIGDALWDVWLARLDGTRLALYARQVHADKRLRESIHSLRNPIYGIRAAVKILLGRELDDELRAVLSQIERAAEQAERGVAQLERSR